MKHGLSKEVYDKIGLYSLNYKIVADYDFMLRMLSDKQIKLQFDGLQTVIISSY